MFRSAVQPRPFGKGQAGEWRRVPKWLIKSHSDATRVSWKIPLMSAVSNVSHRKSHQGQQPSRANYWGQEQLRMVVMGSCPEHPGSGLSTAIFCLAGLAGEQWGRLERAGTGDVAGECSAPSIHPCPDHEAHGSTSLQESLSILGKRSKEHRLPQLVLYKRNKEATKTNSCFFQAT